MPEIETIPLPERETNLGEPFHLEVGDLTAWPDQQFALDFEYNDHRDRWSWQMTHKATERDIGGTANLEVVNSFWPYMLQQFIPARGVSDVDGITRSTLGSKVKFAIYPGPRGGDFLPNSGVSQEDRERLLAEGQDDYWWYDE